jgi:hypothetical protein
MGNDGRYAVERTANGEKHYLAHSGGIAPRQLDLAKAIGSVKVLEGGSPVAGDWVKWPTHGLPSKKPCSMFPPARSHYDSRANA